MMPQRPELILVLVRHLTEVRRAFGYEETVFDERTPLADLVDSMGLVEFTVSVGQECGLSREEMERRTGGRYHTLAALADDLLKGGAA